MLNSDDEADRRWAGYWYQWCVNYCITFGGGTSLLSL
jgi:hypothetical protein